MFYFVSRLIIGLFFCICVALGDELYFMPSEQKAALNAMLDEFSTAQKSIDVAIYSFTNREIAKTLRDAARRGVRVRVIYDKKSNQDPQKSTIGYLAKLKNLSICTLEGLPTKRYSGIMHMKLAIIDGRNVVLGSANWSKSAFETNYETLLILKNSKFAKKASNEYNAMFKVCKKY